MKNDIEKQLEIWYKLYRDGKIADKYTKSDYYL